jgi:arylsulfatase
MAQAVAMMTQPDGKARVQAASKDGSLRPDFGQAGRDPRRVRRPLPVHALLLAEAAQPADVARVAATGTMSSSTTWPGIRTKSSTSPPTGPSGELLLAMNDKLNRLIDGEVGEDVGQMLPSGLDGGWVATDAVKDV